MGVITLLLLFIALAFIVRFFLAPFSRKIRNQIREHHFLHFLGGMIALCYCFFWFALIRQMWPPHWLELRKQRNIVAERVQTAGGWDELRNGCVRLTQTHEDDGFVWFRREPQTLPVSIASLNPQEVRFYPPQWLPKDASKLSVVHIKILGMHATGGHSTPYYGLDVICEPGTPAYAPNPAPTALGNSYFQYRKLAENICEVF